MRRGSCTSAQQREDGEAMRSPGIQGEDEQAGIALRGEDEAQQGF